MTNSVHKDWNGPDWPLGVVVVATAGTPVNIMSLVDSGNVNDPATGTPTIGGQIPSPPIAPKTGDTSNEYTVRFQQIIFQGLKAGASHGLQNNSGFIYIVRKAQGSGSGNRDDYGDIVAAIAPGQSFVLGSAALNRNVYNPYRYSVDADNNGDSCLVTGIVQ
jgi:hypothetical protein